MVQNEAAWIVAAKAKPLKVGSAPEPHANAGEVVIKNAAVAVSPVDWKIQEIDLFRQQYPSILGFDVAGTIESVGEGVTHLHKGQRVLAVCDGADTGKTANMGFQLYSTTSALLVSPIPDGLSFEKAAVLPSSILTAAAGLYQKNNLALPLPTPEPKGPTGQTLLVWGGASSVGGAVVQLAVASGLNVVATASSHNHSHVRGLGASKVFDYKSPTVVDDLAEALGSVKLAGVYDAASVEDSISKIGAVLDKIGTSAKVALVLPASDLPSSIQPLPLHGMTLAHEENRDECKAIWQDFVPRALQEGRLQPKPDPLVVGTGLDKIQDGLDALRAGVSAKKIVVKLQE
ncbi:aflH/ adhA/ short chain alcohol dehydrogenase [Macrophomina phaseolina MS6]|uniref:AflH/ adhA/ short chain alcohol dehydrogenase n=1 Tax=Macrophomina phaseolina (strain MS6) TaxID=1126212 RepID=K2SBW7_MACPH|nr:aflH/ adhA/ short chain alcohol dehydrogenase [Macrophomina phaseolina MS6]